MTSRCRAKFFRAPGAAKRLVFSGLGRVRMSFLTLFASASVATWGTHSTLAHAGDTAKVELQYTRGLGAEHCPDEDVLRQAVQEHLGYDPFVPHAPRIVSVVISKSGRSGLTARIDHKDAQGTVVGTHSLDSPSSGCRELVSSVAFAVSIAIDPLVAAAPHSPPPAKDKVSPPSTPPSTEVATDRQDRTVASHESTGSPWSSIVSAAFVAGLGSSPSLAYGGSLELQLRRKDLSIGLDGRAEAPASAAVSGFGGARVESSMWTGMVVPCFHHGPLALCACGALGALSGTATNVALQEKHTTVFSSLGGRVGFRWPLGRVFDIGMYADVLATLTPTTLRIDDVPVWSTFPVAGTLGLEGSVHFP
jgi:hypothetical protein